MSTCRLRFFRNLGAVQTDRLKLIFLLTSNKIVKNYIYIRVFRRVLADVHTSTQRGCRPTLAAQFETYSLAYITFHVFKLGLNCNTTANI